MRYGPRVHVALIGLRCAGKTSVGRRLAELLERPFVDVDDEIALAFERDVALDPDGHPSRRSAGEILAREGEACFRDLEESVLAETLSRSRALVIATGGGAVERATNRTRLAGLATCVWLRVETPELERRMRADRTLRPALSGGDPVREIAALARRREPWYAAIADHTFDAGSRGVDRVAQEVRARLEDEGFGREG